MRRDQLYRALEVSLEAIQSGMDLEKVLSLYPRWRSELRPLIRSALIAHQLGQAINVPEDALSHHRVLFLQSAQVAIPERGKSRRQFPWQACLGMVFLGLCMVTALLGLGWVSARALPGSVFYPVKEYARWARLIWTGSSIHSIEANLAFDQQRREEIELLIQRKRSAQVDFSGNLSQNSAGEWLVNNLRVIPQTYTQMVGNIRPGYYVQVQGILQADGSILAQRIQARQFLVRGVIESLTLERLMVDQQSIIIAPDTLVLGELAEGARFEAVVLVSADQLYMARWIKVLSPYILPYPTTQPN